jgi:hypothetical protein
MVQDGDGKFEVGLHPPETIEMYDVYFKPLVIGVMNEIS